MANPQGEPIWYELMSGDLARSQPFYEAVTGWKFHSFAEMEAVEGYRFIRYGDGDYDTLGGALQLSNEMLSGGAKPMWAVYFAVADVDRTVAAIAAAGGSVIMPAFDLEKIGRMAMVADPQGNPFYVMRGFSDMESQVFGSEGGQLGRCGWNELITTDLEPALAFYREILGIEANERMPMSEPYGDYVFLDVGNTRIGAAMQTPGDPPPGWRFYFRVADIETAKAAVEAHGGQVLMGPHEVPGEEMIILATDPEGIGFGLVAPKAG